MLSSGQLEVLLDFRLTRKTLVQFKRTLGLRIYILIHTNSIHIFQEHGDCLWFNIDSPIYPKGDINLLHYYKRPSPHFIIIMSINLSVLLKYKKGNIDKKLDYKSIKGST